jgi:hypothetical protein
MKRRITTLLAATALATGMMSGTAFAEPPSVPGPPTHEHSLTTPGNGNVVKIGPPVCRVPQAERGARNFHLKVHSVMAGAAPVTKAGLQIGFYPNPDFPPVQADGTWCAPQD